MNTDIFDSIRDDFPQLKRKIDGKPLVYLDSAATSLKPKSVIDAIVEYYTQHCANIFRGIYTLSEEATTLHEEARAKMATFIGAQSPDEIIFTRNASESINLVYYSWAKHNLKQGDDIVFTVMEHHSNLVPWQEWGAENGSRVVSWGVDEEGLLPMNQLEGLVTKKTKLVALTAASNVLGTIPPIQTIVTKVREISPSCVILVDAAQAVPHMPVDVRAWGADFVAFSGHKMLGPTGIGVLWGERELLERMTPFMYGGEMIKHVSLKEAQYAPIPHKFEAGTPHIAGAIGLGAAVDFLSRLGMDAVRRHEVELTQYALDALGNIPEVIVYGPTDTAHRGGVLTFSVNGMHPHDVAEVLNADNVCIRSGHHCAMPLHQELKLIASCRASLYVYTNKSDIDALIRGIQKAIQMFS